jgi:uncharacterized protein
MRSIFLLLFDFFQYRTRLLYGTFISMFIALAIGASQIKLEEDISKFFPTDKKLDRINEVLQGSRFSERLVILVSLKDSTAAAQPEMLIEYADTLVTDMQAGLSSYIGRINYRVDDDIALRMFDIIYRYLPVFLTDEDFATLDSITGPSAIHASMEGNYRQLISPTGVATKRIIVQDPIGVSRIVLSKLQRLQYSGDVELYDNYFITKDRKHLLVFVSPKQAQNNTGANARFLSGLDGVIENVSRKIPSATATYFGAAAVAVGNANQLHDDTVLTVSVMVALLFIFLYGFLRKKSALVLIFIPVLFGGLFSLTVIFFIQGAISVLAIAAGSIVLGLAINYSLHFLSHLKETKNVRQVVKDMQWPLTLGSATTVLAFLSLQFANATMVRDIGFFAGFSLVGAAVCSLVFLPHFLSDDFFGSGAKQGWRIKPFLIKPSGSRYVVIAILLLTPVMLYLAKDVKFNSDMNTLNFMSPSLKQTGEKLNRISQNAAHSVFVVFKGASVEEALRKNETAVPKLDMLKGNNIVQKYSSVSSFLISDSLQRHRITRWRAYWADEKKAAVMSALKAESARLKFSPTAYKNFDSLINRPYTVMDSTSFVMLKKSFFEDFVTEKPGAATVITLAWVYPSSMPSFYEAFENEKGVDAFDKRMMVNLFVSRVHDDFTFIVTVTSILVFAILLLSYGRIELAFITFLPMLITWIWILGAMALLGIEFNIVNVTISTFIFGLGDDYSIFIVDGLQKKYTVGASTLGSTQESVFLSAITTISGLGVLIFAQHPALRSIAAMSIIGIVMVFIMSQTVAPFLFAKVIAERAKRKLPPITFALALMSFLIYSIFISGALLLTLIGFIFFKVLHLSDSRTRYVYHVILQFFMRLMIATGMPIRKKIINGSGQYQQPRVIISNHQSFIDILLTAMMHPKVLLLTNHWVWNSPLFGWVVKLADYYPVDAGAEGSVNKLRLRVQEGYSIMVFPEGTRSVDGVIGRFHKGAFFIAEKLKLDIQPLLIHGTGESIPKGEIYINRADLTMKFLSPISSDDARYGGSYSERAKSIGQYFRVEYQKFSEEIQTPRHFRHKLISNYLYKGPVLEWYLRIKLRLEDYYEPVCNLVPRTASVLDLGCGYGFLDYVLQFTSPHRTILGVDYDEEKIAVANHGYLKGSNLSFACADITQYELAKFDSIIISDVLHYLSEPQQDELLVKCFNGLNPGGILIVRDGDRDIRGKHNATRLTEFFSVTLLGFNKSNKPLTFISGRRITELAERFGMDATRVAGQQLTSNVIFTIKKRN